jgi:hypothetical protein
MMLLPLPTMEMSTMVFDDCGISYDYFVLRINDFFTVNLHV